jgi:tRNA threonylcarbamoyl adenosine modification protein YjeE
MLPTTAEGSNFTVTVPNEAALHRLVVETAMALLPGDLVTLSGDLGAGKTTFARALIRYLADNDMIEVPSPTFNLMQSYELPQFPLVHADLYRLSGSAELAELGFDDLPETAVLLLEWPDRAAGFLPPDRIDIALTLVPQLGLDHRNVRVTGYGALAARVERMMAIRNFLAEAGFEDAERWRVQGDASTRSYERLVLRGQSYIMMNAPRRPDGPPVRDGKPYSAIAHLAEDVAPFVALAMGLRARGLSAPDIFHADFERGLLLLEDLGDERVVRGEPPLPIEERYAVAVDLLVALHGEALPPMLPVAGYDDYRLPHYDINAMLIEAELLLDWYLRRANAPVAASARAAFVALWRDALQPALEAPPTWVLRDFHSPNLLWLPERHDVARIGVLDFQDALIGPAAYDVASLLQDARVDVDEDLEFRLIGRYLRARHERDPVFDVQAFVQLYATMAAQRATKILGIFARLDLRDRKPQYLRHLPRIWSYLQRALAHPSLGPLRAWYDANVPEP